MPCDFFERQKTAAISLLGGLVDKPSGQIVGDILLYRSSSEDACKKAIGKLLESQVSLSKNVPWGFLKKRPMELFEKRVFHSGGFPVDILHALSLDER